VVETGGRVQVVADSACGLTEQRAGELGVTLVPFLLVINGASLRDGRDISAGDFFSGLADMKALPTTSAPAPGAFRETYDSVWAAGGGVVCITAASSVTAAQTSAVLAAQDAEGPVEVIDSGQASGGEALVVTAAARAAARGAGTSEVAAAARQVAGSVKLVATIDTFKYLRRSGRVKALAALAAGTLHLKPLFTMQGGEITPMGHPLGREESLQRIVGSIEADAAEHPGTRLHVAALHAACASDGMRLLDAVARFDPVESELTEFTPVMGTHTGPGTCGLAWWWET